MINFGFSYNSSFSFSDLDSLLKVGFEFVEINKSVKREELNLLKDLGFKFSFHISFLGGINPSYPIERIRKSVVDEIKKEIDFALSFSAVNLTMHGGYVPWFDFLPEEFEESKDYELIAKEQRRYHLEALILSISEILQNYSDIVLSIENLYFPFDLCNTPQELDFLVRRFKNLFVTLDFGHAKISGFRISDYTKKLADRITKIHLHTNNGFYDLHRPIFEIDSDFANSLRYLNIQKHKIIGIIELHRSADDISKSLTKIKNFLGGGEVV